MILIIGEHDGGTVKQETFEALSFAKNLFKISGGDITVLFPGHDIEGMVKGFADKTGADCIAVESKSLTVYSLEGYCKAVSMFCSELDPSFICIPQTARGSDFGPYLAASIGMECITGVEEISPSKNGPVFMGTSWHGKVKAAVLSEISAVITIFPGAFKWDGKKGEGTGSVEVKKIELTLEKTVSVESTHSESKGVNLKDADIIIGAGNGISKEENMELILKLASSFKRSAVAGSRVACDKGWVDYGQQVGMTGQKVAPRAYIACGISGSMQHIMGMKDSGFIGAINRDPDAPIFKYSDVAVVEDLEIFIPLLIEAIEEKG